MMPCAADGACSCGCRSCRLLLTIAAPGLLPSASIRCCTVCACCCCCCCQTSVSTVLPAAVAGIPNSFAIRAQAAAVVKCITLQAACWTMHAAGAVTPPNLRGCHLKRLLLLPDSVPDAAAVMLLLANSPALLCWQQPLPLQPCPTTPTHTKLPLPLTRLHSLPSAFQFVTCALTLRNMGSA